MDTPNTSQQYITSQQKEYLEKNDPPICNGQLLKNTMRAGFKKIGEKMQCTLTHLALGLRAWFAIGCPLLVLAMRLKPDVCVVCPTYSVEKNTFDAFFCVGRCRCVRSQIKDRASVYVVCQS